MPDLPLALAALQRMAHLLDANTAQLGAPTRYERINADYETALLEAYQSWVKGLIKRLAGLSDSERKIEIDASAKTLLADLKLAGQEHLPYAVTAIGVQDYVPSPDAWRMIADAIDAQNLDLETRLVPNVIEKLQRGVDEGADVSAVAESLLPRVAFYSGNQWATIQKLVGDFAAQAQTRDDLIYPCRWVRVKDDHSCESCIEFAREYPSYDAMLEATGQCVPGFFVGSPYRSCWLNCRCEINLFINGKWTRV